MHVFRSSGVALGPADPGNFLGSAHAKAMAAADVGGVSLHLYYVTFDADARNNWHTHTGPQWLIVVDGSIRVQAWGEPAVDLEAGDAIAIEPGLKHWHGATPGRSGTHYAINVNAQTTWLERVSDEQYAGR